MPSIPTPLHGDVVKRRPSPGAARVLALGFDARSCAKVARLLALEDLPSPTFLGREEFRLRYRRRRPECLVLRLGSDDRDGRELQRELTARPGFAPHVILAARIDVPLAVQVMKRGALDVLLDPIPGEDLTAAVRRGLELDGAWRRGEGPLGSLTPREQEVLGLVVEGLASKRIAARLGISPRTVELHRSNIMRKSGAGSVAELVRVAIAEGAVAG